MSIQKTAPIIKAVTLLNHECVLTITRKSLPVPTTSFLNPGHLTSTAHAHFHSQTILPMSHTFRMTSHSHTSASRSLSTVAPLK
ncbi:hypothetical protein M8C21_034030 [Ambrosia artemisiifolia]|uniref:Uncharacterized protein n=1 Tax=Ambrosia artemisiifolia TaxID=4212 RepID=A0AAD5CNT3_AMBAR|nr:hypothetical protein M8C21_034030 [Ambrosia artemisiifolia]